MKTKTSKSPELLCSTQQTGWFCFITTWILRRLLHKMVFTHLHFFCRHWNNSQTLTTKVRQVVEWLNRAVDEVIVKAHHHLNMATFQLSKLHSLRLRSVQIIMWGLSISTDHHVLSSMFVFMPGVQSVERRKGGRNNAIHFKALLYLFCNLRRGTGLLTTPLHNILQSLVLNLVKAPPTAPQRAWPHSQPWSQPSPRSFSSNPTFFSPKKLTSPSFHN